MFDNKMNRACCAKVQTVLDKAYEKVFTEGFYGTVNLSITVKDGIAQKIEHSIDRTELITKTSVSEEL